MLVDIELGPGPDGLELVSEIIAESPSTGIVFLTNLPDPRVVGKDSKLVPKHAAYLRKSNTVDSQLLVAALDAVLTKANLSSFRHDLALDRPLASLSRKQLEILNLIAKGKTNQQIANTRNTTLRAVEAIISRTFEAMGIDVKSEGNARVEAVKQYFAAKGSAV